MILGDFNDFKTKRFSAELNLTDIVTVPTRGKNTLDHIIISKDLKTCYESSKVRCESPIGKYDHCTLIASPKYRQCKLNDTRRERRKKDKEAGGRGTGED